MFRVLLHRSSTFFCVKADFSRLATQQESQKSLSTLSIKIIKIVVVPSVHRRAGVLACFLFRQPGRKFLQSRLEFSVQLTAQQRDNGN